QHEGYFGVDLVTLNHSEMTRTTPELASLSPSFRTTPAVGRLVSYVLFKVQQVHIRGGSSVESGFEPVTFRYRSRDLTTSPSPARI
ncbi:hypothetical protein AVEN_160501-1, partial [Araneus ventricosus]